MRNAYQSSFLNFLVLKRLSLSDQSDLTPLSTQEISEFFFQQRERELALRQQQRESMEFLHHYRGGEVSMNGGHPVFAKENICSKTNDLKNPAYSSMADIDPFAQQQMEMARELKLQKQSALQNIRSFRSSYPFREKKTKDGERDVPSVFTSFSLDERDSQGLSVLPRVGPRMSKDEISAEDQERDVNDVLVPRFQSLRQSYEDKLDRLTRSPYSISPFGRDSSDSSTASSALRRFTALSSPYGMESSDCSTSSRKLAVIGSQDMDRSDAHIFEDGEESVEDFESGFRSASRSNFVVLRHSESLSDIALPELHSPSDMCLDCSPEAAMLIIRAERLDSLETSFDGLNISSCESEKELPRLQLKSNAGDEVDDKRTKSAVKVGRKSHIVPPSVRANRNNVEGDDAPEGEESRPTPSIARASGIVPPSRRSSKLNSEMSFVDSDDESETDVLSGSDYDSDNPGLREAKHQAQQSVAGSGETTSHHSQQPTFQRRKSKLVFPSVRSSKDASNKPLMRLSLRSIFRLTGRAPSTPPLKAVPLYSRHPIDNKREVPAICKLQFIPDLHKSRAGCERCLYWASQDQRDKFEQTGHHFRIMMARGGCDRSCAVFPRESDEYPVRLCRKCFFDTHQFGKYYTV